LQIATKWFFDNQPAPVAVWLGGQACTGNLLGNIAKEGRRRRHIKEVIAWYFTLIAKLTQFLR